MILRPCVSSFPFLNVLPTFSRVFSNAVLPSLPPPSYPSYFALVFPLLSAFPSLHLPLSSFLAPMHVSSGRLFPRLSSLHLFPPLLLPPFLLYSLHFSISSISSLILRLLSLLPSSFSFSPPSAHLNLILTLSSFI